MNEFLPGFEPEAAERVQLRLVGGIIDLRQFDKILISVSGGKDSHAMLWLVCDLADRQGVPRDRLLEAMYRIECKINSAKTACPPFVQHEFGGAQKWAHEALEGGK